MSKSKKFLEAPVSGFLNANDNQPKPTSLARWLFLHVSRYKDMVDQIRAEKDPSRRSMLKKRLPAITPSGQFKGGRTEKHLVQHSGIICLDFDGVRDIGHTKKMLSKLNFILYAGLSAGGAGLYALVPIENPAKHKSHFLALRNHFQSMGLAIDPTCSNIGRLRFYSYDENPLINLNPSVYSRIAELVTRQSPLPAIRSLDNKKTNDIERVINRIESQRIDITSQYGDWYTIGAILAYEFGEQGRGYYHRFSRFYKAYNTCESDKQYDKCLRNRKPYSINLLFHILKRQNIYFNNVLRS
jgi:hypothetical protein